jgi:hypothetical protein
MFLARFISEAGFPDQEAGIAGLLIMPTLQG